MVVLVLVWKGFFLCVESCRWCMGLPAMAYSCLWNLKASLKKNGGEIQPKQDVLACKIWTELMGGWVQVRA